MNARTVVALLLALAALFGCATATYTDAPPALGGMYSKYAYLGYPGEMRRIEDVGIVTTDGSITILAVDGQSVAELKAFKSAGRSASGRYQLHLLPGMHALVLSVGEARGASAKAWTTSHLTKIISISKGQVVHLTLSESGNTWNAKATDGRAALDSITSDFRELTKKK